MKTTSLIALIVLAFGPACASASKKTYEYWPRPPTQSVAVGAAAAAAVMTLANPDSAGRKEGDASEDKEPRPKRGQQMPSSILDDLDESERNAATDGDSVPCESSGGQAKDAPHGAQRVAIVPTAPRTQPGCAKQ